MRKYNYGPWLVTFSAMLWAMDAPFRKYLTTQLSSTTIVLMETILICICLLPIFLPRLRELGKLTWREWCSVIFIGLGGQALAGVFFTQSFHYVSPTVAILLQKLQPLMAIGLAVWILGEKLHKNFWLWAVLGIFGAYLVSFPTLNPGTLSATSLLGVFLALAAAFFWGGSTVFGRYVLDQVSFQAMTGLRFYSGLVFLFFLNVYYKTLPEIRLATQKDWFFVFMTAIIAGFISLLIYYYGLKTTKASVATLCELAFPVAAVIINWIFLGAALLPMQIVGGLVLLFAITQLTLVNQTDTKDKTAQAEARAA